MQLLHVMLQPVGYHYTKGQQGGHTITVLVRVSKVPKILRSFLIFEKTRRQLVRILKKNS